jgi:hypothetical protein
MENLRRVQSCRWGGLTLYLPYPLWLMAEGCQWCCLHDSPPQPLVSSEVCGTCQLWEPRPAAAAEGETTSGLAVR